MRLFKVGLRIEQAVHMMEQLGDVYRREWVDYHNKKTDLEAGIIRESILPPHHLCEILSHAQGDRLIVQNYQ